MGPIQWTRSAQSDLRAIHDYIARDSPYYARQTVDDIRRAAVRLADSFPAGAIVLEWDEPNLREVYTGTYRVIGSRGDLGVTIIAVIHSSRQLPDSPEISDDA